jgi:hypothetical protein
MMEIWNQPLEARIAAAEERLLIERCSHLHHVRAPRPVA